MPNELTDTDAELFVPMPKPLSQSSGGDRNESERITRIQPDIGRTAGSVRARLFGNLTINGLLQGIKPRS